MVTARTIRRMPRSSRWSFDAIKDLKVSFGGHLNWGDNPNPEGGVLSGNAARRREGGAGGTESPEVEPNAERDAHDSVIPEPNAENTSVTPPSQDVAR